jgi:general stress protein 26
MSKNQSPKSQRKWQESILPFFQHTPKVGEIANRPMSNNGDVAYDGTSHYFSYEQARAVSDIQGNPKVALGFSSEAGLFSQGVYVAVEGTAELIRDKAALRQHWTSDLDKWFDNGGDTRHRADQGQGEPRNLLERPRRG